MRRKLSEAVRGEVERGREKVADWQGIDARWVRDTANGLGR